MRKVLLSLLAIVLLGSWQAMGQCGTISLIGEFNGWAGDHVMTRSLDNPAQFTTIVKFTEEDDTSDPPDGIIEMKFRENGDWVVNWGSADFPTGTGVQDGDNVPVPPGIYIVTFDCSTGDYSFTTTCGEIGLIGEFNGWADDYWMGRDPMNPDMWMTTITLTDAHDASDPPDGIIELKFRQDSDWGVNWGSADFPSGTGVQDGDNIPVPVGNYKVTFNCATGEYNFIATCGVVSIIGEFNGWAADYPLIQNPLDPDVWYGILTLDNATADASDPPDGIAELKFRANADWGVNWGSSDFPIGTGEQDGDNIPVPLDGTGLTTDYNVLFNCATGAYTFVESSGQISMIGAFNGWNGDVDMYRDPTVPNVWHLKRAWFEDSEVKFRENHDWSVNWGSTGWPTGTGEDNGDNIPLVAGAYDVMFDWNTKEYSFTPNNDICSEILVNYWDGEANEFTVNMVRDPMHPSQFSLLYNFTSSVTMFFKMDDGMTISNDNVWGGTFPCGNGVHDVTKIFSVPGGKYNITFNCESGDFCFERLGNAVIASEVFAMNMDGDLSDSDWNLDQNVSRIVDGTATEDLNTVDFGVTWNDTYLYIGVNITDGIIMPNESGELFVDGDKSGGDYDAHDIHIKFGAAGPQVITGPDGYEVDLATEFGFGLTGAGYTAEVAIRWADLGVTPEEGGQIGFDIIINDDDNGAAVDYSLAWNGDLNDTISTSNFGDLVFGGLSCGAISVFNATIGDVALQNPSEMPTTYVGTYTFDDGLELMFRKDKQGTVTWSTDAWPTGTATLGGPTIPGAAGSYRITFDCLTGDFSFDADTLAGVGGIAMANYLENPGTIDGDLSEYSLDYDSEIMNPETATNNNVVAWGAAWDRDYMYVGVQVTDAVVEWNNVDSPWENDAIEFYIDGNNDKDGQYDADFDTQLIMDVNEETGLWIKADGVQPDSTQYEAIFLPTDDGYNVEVKMMWDVFSFAPGKNRTIGFSLGNNDSDNAVGRDYQTLWYGDGTNWSDTKMLGNMQLAGGPYFFVDGFDEDVLYNANVILYPNPTTGNVTLQTIDNVFSGNVTILVADISGRIVLQTEENLSGLTSVQLTTNNLNRGIYFVNVLGQDGKRAVKKLIVQ